MPKLTYSSGGVDIPARTFWMTKDVVVHNARGTSKADVMSQASVTHELELHDTQIFNLTQDKLNKSEAEQIYLSKVLAETLYQPIGDYAYKSDLPEFNPADYLLKSELPTQISYFENDAEYLTQSYLDGKYYTIPQITEIVDNVKANSEALLYNYYDRDQVDELLKKSKENDNAIHNLYEQRLSDLEAIDHNIFAEKSELENYVTVENFDNEIANHYTKEQTDKAIAEAITGENIGSLLSKEEASETYQPIGDYLTEHQDLTDYAKKDEVSSEIDTKVTEAVDNLHISDYLTITDAEQTYQPKGDYLTEHQSLADYMTIARAEEEHAQISEDLSELDERLKIAEKLCADYEFFDNWQPGYYENTDYSLSNLIQHDGCYHMIASVENCKPADFFCHYPPLTNNLYIQEYSGIPAQDTYIKSTIKNNFDLTLELNPKTKYIAVFAYTPILNTTDFYCRGIKVTDESEEHVTKEEFDAFKEEIGDYVAFDDTELKNRLNALESIDHSEFALKSEVENYDDTALSARVSAIEADYITDDKLSGYTYSKEAIDAKIGDIDVTDQLAEYAKSADVTEEIGNAIDSLEIDNYATKSELNQTVTEKFNEIVKDAPENFNTFKEVADYVEEHKEVAKALQEAINDKADKSALNGLASEAYVQEKISEIEIPEEYNDEAIKSEISEIKRDYALKSEIPDDYATESFVTGKIAEIEIPEEYDDTALSNRISVIEADYLKSESLDNYYDKTQIDAKIGEIDVTEQLTDYAKTADVSEMIDSLHIENYLAKTEADELYLTQDDLKSTDDAVEAVSHKVTAIEEQLGGIDELLKEILGEEE